MNNAHAIIAVTPAGRRHYLEILKRYVLGDESIEQWQLWDNCRKQSDREYIEELARGHSKIRIVRAKAVDGTNRAINQFYQGLTDRNTFYIKLDDDIVYLPERFGARLYEAARQEQGQFLYWSPLVVNNAICSWLIKHHSDMDVPADLIAAASCTTGWRNPFFAEQLHRAFIGAIGRNSIECFAVPNFRISLARFSINCIGFFGADVADIGTRFCPSDCDDEEWISAVLPSHVGKCGRIIGDLIIAHFSFFTQETELLRAGVLEDYFRIAEVVPVPYDRRYASLRKFLRRMIELHVLRRYPRIAPIVRKAPRAHAGSVPSVEAYAPAKAAGLQTDLPS